MVRVRIRARVGQCRRLPAGCYAAAPYLVRVKVRVRVRVRFRVRVS